MSLKKLILQGIRNLEKATLIPDNKINIIVGNNASGKSSFLEAIYILGTGTSFRTSRMNEVIQHGCSEMLVSGILEDRTDQPVNIGISYRRSRRIIRIDGVNVQSRAQLASQFPIQVIYPGSFQLIEGAPATRRKFLDWGLFYSIPEYYSDWIRYKRALVQRNSCLRSSHRNTRVHPEIWNRELVKYGTIITAHRKAYLEKFDPVFREIAGEFLPRFNVDIIFDAGWNDKLDLQTVLEQNSEKDFAQGFTTSGPHRCEFQLSVNGVQGKSFLSRGQIKLLILALKLSQISLNASECGKKGCLLIDDLNSEIDEKNLALLIEFLRKLDIQFFITAIDKSKVQDFARDRSMMFHVEHGLIKGSLNIFQDY